MEGWHGWDDYAQFYDWENARTVGRRDVPFWQALARRSGGPVLELGCGTGRVSFPVAKTVDRLVGIDRSGPMIARARRRLRRGGAGGRLQLVRGDVRALPFGDPGPFRLVMAPYGVLQSLLRERDLRQTLASVYDALAPGGSFAMDLVPDLPTWREYARRVSLRGRRRGSATRVTLVESVRQDRGRRLTHFDQEFVERKGRSTSVHRFSLTFRTLSVRQMSARLRTAGFELESVAGDYVGGPWHREAETWVVIARR
jgi:ubiquinone/menaquinone biosynthesis C-methylase UbiE